MWVFTYSTLAATIEYRQVLDFIHEVYIHSSFYVNVENGEQNSPYWILFTLFELYAICYLSMSILFLLGLDKNLVWFDTLV